MEYNEIKENITKLETIVQEVKEGIDQLQTKTIDVEPEKIIYPEILLQLSNGLIEILDQYNNRKRLVLKRILDKLGYDEFIKQHSNSDYLLCTKTIKEIHADSETYVNNTIANGYDRITSIVGVNPDFTELSLVNNQLDGIVSGNGHKASVKSTIAGGYGVQDLHIRFFVKEL